MCRHGVLFWFICIKCSPSFVRLKFIYNKSDRQFAQMCIWISWANAKQIKWRKNNNKIKHSTIDEFGYCDGINGLSESLYTISRNLKFSWDTKFRKNIIIFSVFFFFFCRQKTDILSMQVLINVTNSN